MFKYTLERLPFLQELLRCIFEEFTAKKCYFGEKRAKACTVIYSLHSAVGNTLH